MKLVGGLRERLIHDNLADMLQDGLRALGWLDPGRSHLPVSFVPYPMDRDQNIPLNTIALSDENITEKYAEIGSSLSEHTWTFYLDIYAESPSIGMHLRGDLEALLKGRFATIGIGVPMLPVYDLTQATPPLLFYCEILEVVRDKGQEWSGTKPWMKFWYLLRVDIHDWYGRSDDGSYYYSP